MNIEAAFHGRIKAMLSKKHQGYVMGAFRLTMKEAGIDLKQKPAPEPPKEKTSG